MDESGQNRKLRLWPPRDFPMFAVTLAAFLAAAVYAYITYRQFGAGREANELTEKQFYIANRPYIVTVGFPVAIVSSVVGGKAHVFLAVAFKNSGKTPVVKTVVTLCQPIIRDNNTQPALKCVVPEAPSSYASVVGPEQTQALGSRAVEKKTWDDTLEFKKFVYFFGNMVYKDNLRKDEVHETRFCTKIRKSIVSAPSTPISGVLQHEGSLTDDCHDVTWECIDDGCPKLP
jgi:hypothetical protein